MGLNPCFGGRWSRSYNGNPIENINKDVLILVLVEDGLGENGNDVFTTINFSLNPCFGGRWSRRKW